MKKYFYIVATLAILILVATSCIPFINTEFPEENEPPVAYIDSISPSEAEVGETVTFQGHGTDNDGNVVAYRWSSSIDGDLGTTETFQSSSLSAGTHVISFVVQDNNGDWSEIESATVNINTPEPAPITELDLVITDIRKIGTFSGYIIGYTIENHGDHEAGSTKSALYANGDLIVTENVPPIAAGDSIDREFVDWIFNPLMPDIEIVIDRDDDVAESDEDNNEMQVSIEVEVVYDFVNRAFTVDWQSGPPKISIGFGGETNDPHGFACFQTDKKLEDGSEPTKVLETHPRWVDDGWIEGVYEEMVYDNYLVESGEHFFARVGFLQGAGDGNVTFNVIILPEGGVDTWIASVTKSYDGSIETIDVSLEDFVGKKVFFLLLVDANGTSTQDWATWVEAKIIR